MSTKGIYTALSGSIAQNQKLDTIANNIANVNTPAFKRDQQVFREYLTAYEKQPDVIQVPKVPASIESFYDNQGGDRGYVDGSGSYTDHSQGSLKPSGSRLDVAIEGEGFFEVLTPQGPRMTRSGNFTLNAEGQLVTKQGFPVLKRGEGEPQTRSIVINNPNFTVSSNGDIFIDGENTATLSVISVGQKEALQKVGQNLYTFKDTFEPQINRTPEVKLHQGFVENSNVNIVQEMTDMIAATRVFESTQRAIKAYDQMEDRLVNDVPQLR